MLFHLFAVINILQKNKNGYYGELLPTFLTVEKLILLRQKIRQGSIILNSCLTGILKQFLALFKLEDEVAILASCSHLYFKMWRTSKEVVTTSKLENLLVRAAETHAPYPENLCSETTSPTTDHVTYDFEDGGSTASARTGQARVRAEVLHFFDDPRKDMSMLQDVPAVKVVSTRFSTNLCLSAEVERLFSSASLDQTVGALMISCLKSYSC